MKDKEREALNLRVIQRYDLSIKTILDTSCHSVVYHFDDKLQKWNKADFEGVFFLVERSVSPYYSIFILNRKKIENFELFLKPGVEVGSNDTFMIISRPSEPEIGIWLYVSEDIKRITDSIQILLDQR